MAKVRALTERTIAERFQEVKDEEALWGDISAETQACAQRLLQSSIDEDFTLRLGAESYQRCQDRRGWRNGGYRRQLSTRWGILDVWMPRARQALPRTGVLRRFERHEPQVALLIRQAFLRGVSTRQVGAVLAPVLGWPVSAQTVSRITQQIDTQVRRFHWRALDDDWQYLFLDGVRMRVKHPTGVSQKLVLCAYGIRPTGQRVLIDYRLATAESAVQWEAFLSDLARRGLVGQQLRLIVTDGGAGLQAARAVVYGQVPHQSALGGLGAQAPQPCGRPPPPVPAGVSGRSEDDLRRPPRPRCQSPLPTVDRHLAPRRAQSRPLSRAGQRRTARFLRLSARRLADRAHHQCDRAQFPGSPTPHPTDELFSKQSQLRPHRLCGDQSSQ